MYILAMLIDIPVADKDYQTMISLLRLMVSSVVRNTTTAMTIVPFLLIFQLIFSGNFFSLGKADFMKNLTISHWGMDGMCIHTCERVALLGGAPGDDRCFRSCIRHRAAAHRQR